MKKRLTAITLALAMTLGLTACGNTSGQNQQPAGESGQPASDEPIVLRFADTDSADSVAGQGGQMFCDLVEERTDGRVVVEYYPASQLAIRRLPRLPLRARLILLSVPTEILCSFPMLLNG